MKTYKIEHFAAPKKMKLGGMIELEYVAAVKLDETITMYQLRGTDKETWYWGAGNICVHVKNYGPKPTCPGSPWYGWIVTATCGAEPPHYKTREAAFRAAPKYIRRYARRRLAEAESRHKQLVAELSKFTAKKGA